MADVAVGSAGGERQKRKRLKKVCSEIRKQMEFYFSDANLHKDRFLKKVLEQTTDGYVDLEVFSNFNRLRALTTDMSLVAKALSTSTMLKVSDDGKKVQRITPLRDMADVDQRTIYVECLPPTADHDWVRQAFSGCGPVIYVSLPKYRSTGDIKGFAFVEFDTIEAAQKACENWKQTSCHDAPKTARFPRGNRQMLNLQRQVHAKHADTYVKPGSDHTSSRPAKKQRHHRSFSSGDEECDGNSAQQSSQKRTRSDSVDEECGDVKRSAQKETHNDSIDKNGGGDNSERRSRIKRTHSDSVDENSNDSPEKRSTQKRAHSDNPDEGCGENSVQQSTHKHTRSASINPCNDYPENRSTQKRTHHDSLVANSNGKPEKRSAQKRTHTDDDAEDENVIPPKRKATDETAPHCDSTPLGNNNRDTSSDSVHLKQGVTQDASRLDSETSGKESSTGEQHKRKTSDAGKMSHNVKKVRISSDVKVTEVSATHKKKRRRKRSTAPVAKTADMMGVPPLRVMSKEQWLVLRKQYLQLQKESFHQLKESLLHRKQARQQIEDHLPSDCMNQEMNITTAKTERTIEFVPNVILKVTSNQPIIRKELKARLVSSAEIAYIDVADGDSEGYIRFNNCEHATVVAKLQLDDVKFEPLTGTAETEYWSKLASDRERKLNTKANKSKRGRNKVVRKADQAAAQMQQNHVFFED